MAQETTLRPVRGRASSLLAAAAAFTWSAACSGPEAVENPTWADVYPILQGQCLHCHGSTSVRDGASYRFDFLDAIATCRQDDRDELAMGLMPAPSFMSARQEILKDIKPAAPGLRPKMPPEPGRALEDWQVRTIENFIKKLDAVPRQEAAQMGMGALPADASPPRLGNVTYARFRSTLRVTYVAFDDNHEPVIGQLRVGDLLSHPITSAGAGVAEFNLAGVSGPLQITARLCDGWGVKIRGAADGLPVAPN